MTPFDPLHFADQGGNSWIKQMRVLRAFRLLRLLGKLGDIKKIVTAVAMSLVPTLQALVSREWGAFGWAGPGSRPGR